MSWPERRRAVQRPPRRLNDEINDCVYAAVKQLEPFEVQLHPETFQRLLWDWRRLRLTFEQLTASSAVRSVGTRRLTFAARDGLRSDEVAVTDGHTRLYFQID